MLWEDEGTLCFQVEARGICVARREDNHMVNGTKLLNVAGITMGRRDGILKSEKIRHEVKIGPVHLKGVWIPLDRALDLANKEKITELLYPLFVHDIDALLHPPVNSATLQTLQVGNSLSKSQSQIPSIPGSASIHHSSHVLPSLVGRQQLTLNMLFPSFLFPPTPRTDVSNVRGGMIPSGLAVWNHHSMKVAPPPPGPFLGHYTPSSPQTFPGSPSAHPPSFSRKIPAATGGNTPIVRPGNSTDNKPGLPYELLSTSRSPSPPHPRPIQDNSAALPPEPGPISETETPSTNATTDYTTSSGEDEILLTRVDRKTALLKRLMRFFYLIISSPPSPSVYARAHGHGEAQSYSSASGSGVASQGTQNAPASSSSYRGKSRKRQRGGIDNDGDDDDGGRDNKRLRASAVDTPAEVPPPKFACPYFKYNQAKYRMWRSCPGPGWTTVHRIKEHIYRKHVLPIRCPRCHQVFETDGLKDEHISQAERCVRAEDGSPPEGIDADKERLLRSRKGKNKEASEAEKWNDMYLILFPEADPTRLPSPCKFDSRGGRVTTKKTPRLNSLQTTSTPPPPKPPLQDLQDLQGGSLPDMSSSSAENFPVASGKNSRLESRNGSTPSRKVCAGSWLTLSATCSCSSLNFTRPRGIRHLATRDLRQNPPRETWSKGNSQVRIWVNLRLLPSRRSSIPNTLCPLTTSMGKSGILRH